MYSNAWNALIVEMIAWKKMLELNPDYPQRAQVEALIKEAEHATIGQPGGDTVDQLNATVPAPGVALEIDGALSVPTPAVPLPVALDVK